MFGLCIFTSIQHVSIENLCSGCALHIIIPQSCGVHYVYGIMIGRKVGQMAGQWHNYYT